MIKIRKKFKEGAASFYIVAISTLILVIVAASFAAVIISEVTRTSNDDLAQSAYDAALAGVEDAKLAFYSYQSCLENGSPIDASGLSCDEIKTWVESGQKEGQDACDMVSVILGRKREGEGGEVLVQESNVNNDMQQAYTCVKLSDATDYKTTLTAENPTKIMRAHFENGEAAKSVQSVVVSWQRDTNVSQTKYSDLGKDGIFGAETPLPPVISLGLVQTASTFTLDSFDMTQGDSTNRGTLYLVPAGSEIDQSGKGNKYEIAWNEESGVNSIGKEGFLKSNDKTVKNLPYVVRCTDGSEYACSATIELPNPVGGDRNNDTFMFVLSMPYADASTDVRLQFCSKTDGCYEDGKEVVNGEEKSVTTEVPLSKVQIVIDSTGRANDLYRRVETRLEPADKAYPFPLYAIEVLGEDNGSLIDKNISPTCEWGVVNNDPNATGPKGLCENT